MLILNHQTTLLISALLYLVQIKGPNGELNKNKYVIKEKHLLLQSIWGCISFNS